MIAFLAAMPSGKRQLASAPEEIAHSPSGNVYSLQMENLQLRAFMRAQDVGLTIPAVRLLIQPSISFWTAWWLVVSGKDERILGQWSQCVADCLRRIKFVKLRQSA